MAEPAAAVAADFEQTTDSEVRGYWSRAATRFGQNRVAVVSAVVLVVMCVAGLLASKIAPYGYQDVNVLALSQSPSRAHLFGTDGYGRDYLSRVLFGIGTSVKVGMLVGVLATLFGTLVGAIAGYYARFTDELLMRLTDLLLTLPVLPVALVAGVFLHANTPLKAALVLACLLWTSVARIVRGVCLSLRQKEFVESAPCFGCKRCAHHRQAPAPECDPVDRRRGDVDDRDRCCPRGHAGLSRFRCHPHRRERRCPGQPRRHPQGGRERGPLQLVGNHAARPADRRARAGDELRRGRPSRCARPGDPHTRERTQIARRPDARRRAPAGLHAAARRRPLARGRSRPRAAGLAPGAGASLVARAAQAPSDQGPGGARPGGPGDRSSRARRCRGRIDLQARSASHRESMGDGGKQPGRRLPRPWCADRGRRRSRSNRGQECAGRLERLTRDKDPRLFVDRRRSFLDRTSRAGARAVRLREGRSSGRDRGNRASVRRVHRTLGLRRGSRPLALPRRCVSRGSPRGAGSSAGSHRRRTATASTTDPGSPSPAAAASTSPGRGNWRPRARRRC